MFEQTLSMTAVLTIIGSIVIPLGLFLFALRPWVRDTTKLAVAESLGEIKIQLAVLSAEVKAYRDEHKQLIDLYQRKLSKRGNPHPDKEVLLQKLKDETITRDEALFLQQIMNEEQQKAEDQNDILKAIVIIGILALIAYAISKSSGGK